VKFDGTFDRRTVLTTRRSSQKFQQIEEFLLSGMELPPEIPARSATAPQSNLNISQIVPVIVAFWTDSKCELAPQLWGASGQQDQ